MIEQEIISSCWLYCNNCKAFIKWKCSWCQQNIKAEKRCAVKNCCKENKILNCAECNKFTDYKKCKKLNNFISKVFAIVFWSNRFACIDFIKKEWKNEYIKHMKNIKSYNNPNKK